jgi:hypothetical protein
VKANPSCLPLVNLGHNIFGHQHGVPAAANQLVFRRVALGSNQRENRAAIRRRDCHPTSAGFVILINHEGKSKLVNVEPQTAVLIADEDIDTENAKVRVLSI